MVTEGHLIELKHLLLIGALVIVGLCIQSPELEGCQVIGQCGLLLSIKAAQVDLLALLPDVRLKAPRPAVVKDPIYASVRTPEACDLRHLSCLQRHPTAAVVH